MSLMIAFITSNKNKAREFSELLSSKIEIVEAEYPEIKADEPEEISLIAAKMLSERLGRTVIVEDSGLFIKSLNGFPGTSTKYITNRIGNKGIIKLMKGVKDRRCYYKSAIGYCEPGKQALVFTGKEDGQISQKEAGSNGWGNDFIFMPKGKDKTYSQLKKKGESGKFRKWAIKKLNKFLLATGNNR